MAEKLLTDVSDDIAETWHYDDGNIHVRRTQDVEPVIDAVAKANLHGVNQIDGLGRLVMEVPTTVAIAFCERRGIPWEAFLYRNDYDAEFKRFVAEHPKLVYQHRRNLVQVA